MNKSKPLHVGKPKWLQTKLPTGKVYFDIKQMVHSNNLVTVCEEAKCPNIGECWNTGTATFMILGDTCTRACRFCHIKTANNGQMVDPLEPQKIAGNCKKLGLKYVVLTMVNRDDLDDGGANHIADVITKIRSVCRDIRIEILSGDFYGDLSCLKIIRDAGPDVFAHNLETVSRLTPRVRDRRADYMQSLRVLAEYKKISNKQVPTKSSIMLGLGESIEEVHSTLKDMRVHGVELLTIGQYMRPTKKHLSVKEWIKPEYFIQLRDFAMDLGFTAVAASPLVRSSYKAYDQYEAFLRKKMES